MGALWDAEYATPIKQEFKANAGLGAMSQLNGPNVYYRPGGLFSTAGYSVVNIYHETLHNMGANDAQIQKAWGLPIDQNDTKNISDLLIKLKCVK